MALESWLVGLERIGLECIAAGSIIIEWGVAGWVVDCLWFVWMAFWWWRRWLTQKEWFLYHVFFWLILTALCSNMCALIAQATGATQKTKQTTRYFFVHGSKMVEAVQRQTSTDKCKKGPTKRRNSYGPTENQTKNIHIIFCDTQKKILCTSHQCHCHCVQLSTATTHPTSACNPYPPFITFSHKIIRCVCSEASGAI